MAGRLAAILYAHLNGGAVPEARDERAAAFRDILSGEVIAAGGRVAESTPAGWIVEFPAAGAAVSCAQAIIQKVAARNAGSPPADRFTVAIGVAQGDVVEEGGALIGLPVRAAVAARTLADPGGLALTDSVHRTVQDRSALRGTLLRPVRFPHLNEPLRVFVVPPAGVSFPLWLIRKRRMVPVLALLAAGTAAGIFMGLGTNPPPAAPPPAQEAPAPPPRPTRVIESYDEPARISKYDGGGCTLTFTVETGADGSRELSITTTGQGGWWGVVLSREYDWTGGDTLVLPARASIGNTFRIMVTDDDQPFRAVVTATTAGGDIRIPFSAFIPDADAKKKDGTKADGIFNLAKISQIQIIHADPAGSDTLRLGQISIELIPTP